MSFSHGNFTINLEVGSIWVLWRFGALAIFLISSFFLGKDKRNLFNTNKKEY
jgi:hypothetical protein